MSMFVQRSTLSVIFYNCENYDYLLKYKNVKITNFNSAFKIFY